VEKALVWAENLDHLSVMEHWLDTANISWLRIDGGSNQSRRRDTITAFHETPVRVLLGTKVLERGLDGLQHCRVLISLGNTFNPAREAQRVGRIRRVGSPHASVEHHVFLTSTQHEIEKWKTAAGRGEDAVAVLAG
jgi:superfamily II DNA or RNA helicase